MKTKNEERKTKNWGCFGVALQPSTPAGESAIFMTNYKAFGNACESIGGKAAQFFVQKKI